MTNTVKDTRFNILIDHDLKTEFMHVCRKNKQVPSEVIRQMVRQYIKDNSK